MINRLTISTTGLMAVFVFLLIMTPNAVSAQILYGTTHFGSDGLSTLHTIDTATGAATQVGPIGFEKCSGMDFSAAGTLYALCERADGSDTSALITIDPATGTGTEVGSTGIESLGFGNSVTDISIRNSDGDIFAYIVNGQAIVRINPANGAATAIGPANVTTCCGNGIAFTSGDLLYHANESDLNILNQTTGAATFITNLNFLPPADAFPRINSLDLNRDTGVLFASVNNGSSIFPENFLATLNTSTGDVTIIGQTADGLHAIAFQNELQIPTMNQWGMIIFTVFAGLGSTYYLRRKNNRCDK